MLINPVFPHLAGLKTYISTPYKSLVALGKTRDTVGLHGSNRVRLVMRLSRLKRGKFPAVRGTGTLGSKQHMYYKVESGNNGVYIAEGMG